MNVRRPRPAISRPRPSAPAGPSFKTSTAGWYAEWKARKTSAPSAEKPEPAPTTDPPVDAVARWLTADPK